MASYEVFEYTVHACNQSILRERHRGMLEYERFNHPEKSQDIAGSIKKPDLPAY